MPYIIVKYAENFPEGAPLDYSVFRSYSAQQVGVKQSVYDTPEEARPDLEALDKFNPTVNYGIVPLWP